MYGYSEFKSSRCIFSINFFLLMIRTNVVIVIIITNVMKNVISPLIGRLKIKSASSCGKCDDMNPDKNIAIDRVARKNPKNKELYFSGAKLPTKLYPAIEKRISDTAMKNSKTTIQITLILSTEPISI